MKADLILKIKLHKIVDSLKNFTTPSIILGVIFLLIFLLLVWASGCEGILDCVWDMAAPDGVFRLLFLFLFTLIILGIPGFYNFYKALEKQQLEDYEETARYYERVIKYGKAGTVTQVLTRGMNNIIGTDNPRSEIFKVIADVSRGSKIHEVPQILEGSYGYYGFKNAIFSTDILAAAYNGIGNIKAIQEKHDEAISNYTEAIKRNPGSILFYNNRGITNHELGKYKEAISDYDRAIKLDPKYTAAYKNRGNAKVRSGDYGKAISDYNHAIELDPKYTAAYNNRGIAKSELEDYKGAISDYDRAIELDPKHAFSYNNRGNVKRRSGDYTEAISDYDRAIGLDPEYATAYYNRGNAKSGLGDYEGTILDYNRAIELDPKHAFSYNNRGNAKSGLGDYEGAILDYNRVIELDPKHAYAYKNRETAVIAYFQSAYNQHCIQSENSNNKISIDGNFGPQTQKALEVAKVALPDSECHKAYSKYKNTLDKIMKESSQ